MNLFVSEQKNWSESSITFSDRRIWRRMQMYFQSWRDRNHCKCQLYLQPAWSFGLRKSLLGVFAGSLLMSGSHPFESAADRTSTVTPSPRSDLPLILYFPAIKSLATISLVLPKLSMAEILSSVACKCSSNPGWLHI